MSIKLLVCDIAGTTVKDEQRVSIAFRDAMAAHNYTIPVEEIDPIMGYEKTLAIRMMLERYETNKTTISDTLVRSIHQNFVTNMLHYYQNTTDLEALPTVEATFVALQTLGIKIALNTGFSKDIATAIVNRLGWLERGLINYVIASDEVSLGRPEPFMIQQLMQKAGITQPEQVAKIGDTEVDIREGHNAKCRYVIGITTGAYTQSALEPYKPTHIIHQFKDIIPILTS